MKKRAKRTGAATPAATKAETLTGLVERNYGALRSIASREIAQRKLQRTTTPTSLVAETVMRLIRQRRVPRNNSQLCGLATILMTRALADRTRRTQARKRGAARKPLEIDNGIERDLRVTGSAVTGETPKALQARVLSCLQSLSREHPKEMEVITLHLVLGIPMENAAKLMGISRRTAYRCLTDGLASLRDEVGIGRLGDGA